MSELGQTQKSGLATGRSALPSTTDNVPQADIVQLACRPRLETAVDLLPQQDEVDGLGQQSGAPLSIALRLVSELP